MRDPFNLPIATFHTSPFRHSSKLGRFVIINFSIFVIDRHKVDIVFVRPAQRHIDYDIITGDVLWRMCRLRYENVRIG